MQSKSKPPSRSWRPSPLPGRSFHSPSWPPLATRTRPSSACAPATAMGRVGRVGGARAGIFIFPYLRPPPPPPPPHPPHPHHPPHPAPPPRPPPPPHPFSSAGPPPRHRGRDPCGT